MQVSVSIEGVNYDKNLQEDLKVNESDLNQEFCDQSIKYGWWATLASLASHEVDRLKLELDTMEATLDLQTRNDLTNKGVKYTEKMIANLVLTNDVYQQIFKELLEARKNYELLISGARAFSQRKDMLMMLGRASYLENQDPEIVSQQYKKSMQRGKE